MNHYEVLGVSEGAGAAEIRRAYLAEARRHHPDFHSDDEADARRTHARRMQAINEAWSVLGDPAARVEYDATQRLVAPPRHRERPGREPVPPPGKGWTPRPDDDGWQTDFQAWAGDRDVLAPDEPGPGSWSRFTVVPVALFGAGVAAGLLGVVMTSRPLIAVCVASVAVSGALFLVLPLLGMTRGTRPPSTGPPPRRGLDPPHVSDASQRSTPSRAAADRPSADGRRAATGGRSRPRGRGDRRGTVTR